VTLIDVGLIGLKEMSSKSQFSDPSRKAETSRLLGEWTVDVDAVLKREGGCADFDVFDGVRGGETVSFDVLGLSGEGTASKNEASRP